MNLRESNEPLFSCFFKSCYCILLLISCLVGILESTEVKEKKIWGREKKWVINLTIACFDFIKYSFDFSPIWLCVCVSKGRIFHTTTTKREKGRICIYHKNAHVLKKVNIFFLQRCINYQCCCRLTLKAALHGNVLVFSKKKSISLFPSRFCKL